MKTGYINHNDSKGEVSNINNTADPSQITTNPQIQGQAGNAKDSLDKTDKKGKGNRKTYHGRGYQGL